MTNPWSVATSATAAVLSSTRFFFSRSAFLRRQKSPCSAVATMSNSGEKSFCSDSRLESIFKQKKALRSVVKRDLKSMDPFLRSQQDEAIQKIVLEAPWFKACKRLCAYVSCSSLQEVDTSLILAHILQKPSRDGKNLFVPRVEDKNSNMRMLNISSTEDLIANSMDILEPTLVDTEGNEREDVLFADEPIDLFLLPGLAFDKAGRRLGRGGGYYDTFLSRYHELAKERNRKQPLKIGLCYSVQIVDEGTIPLTPNDILVDALVSPSGVIPISPAALEVCH